METERALRALLQAGGDPEDAAVYLGTSKEEVFRLLENPGFRHDYISAVEWLLNHGVYDAETIEEAIAAVKITWN